MLDPSQVPAEDRGFLLGDGLFETVRIYGGVPFRLAAHLERLEAGAIQLGIPVPNDLEWRVRWAVEEGPSEGALRITLSRGPGGDLSGEGAGPPTLALRISPVPDTNEVELHGALEGWVHQGALSTGIKGLSYLERILALRRARERGRDEALVRNARGELVEGSTSNLLAVGPRGELVAPGRRDGALPGITRDVLLTEARQMGLTIQERGLRPGELHTLRELLLTSSIREVVPVVQVEGQPVGLGRPGPVYGQLRARFQEVIRLETTSR
jgi:branched-chain amino acid aminotransferase